MAGLDRELLDLGSVCEANDVESTEPGEIDRCAEHLELALDFVEPVREPAPGDRVVVHDGRIPRQPVQWTLDESIEHTVGHRLENPPIALGPEQRKCSLDMLIDVNPRRCADDRDQCFCDLFGARKWQRVEVCSQPIRVGRLVCGQRPDRVARDDHRQLAEHLITVEADALQAHDRPPGLWGIVVEDLPDGDRPHRRAGTGVGQSRRHRQESFDDIHDVGLDVEVVSAQVSERLLAEQVPQPLVITLHAPNGSAHGSRPQDAVHPDITARCHGIGTRSGHPSDAPGTTCSSRCPHRGGPARTGGQV